MKVCCSVVIVTLLQLLQNVQLAAVKTATDLKSVETTESANIESFSEEDCNSAKKANALRERDNNDIHIYVSQKPSKPKKSNSQLKLRIPIKHYMRSNKKKSSKTKKHKERVPKKEKPTKQTKNETSNNPSNSDSPSISHLSIIPTTPNVRASLLNSADQGDYYYDAQEQRQYDMQNEKADSPSYWSNNEFYATPIQKIARKINVTSPNQTVAVPYDITFYQQQRYPNQQHNYQAYPLETNVIPIPVQRSNPVPTKQYTSLYTNMGYQPVKQGQSPYKVVKNNQATYDIRTQYQNDKQTDNKPTDNKDKQNDNKDKENETQLGNVNSLPQNVALLQNTLTPSNTNPSNNDNASNNQYVVQSQSYDTQSVNVINSNNQNPAQSNSGPLAPLPYEPTSTNSISTYNQYYTQSNNDVDNQLGYSQYPGNWGVSPVTDNSNYNYWPPSPQNGVGGSTANTWNGPSPSPCCMLPPNYCCPAYFNSLGPLRPLGSTGPLGSTNNNAYGQNSFYNLIS